MSQAGLFATAMKCIPPSEKVTNQMVTLYRGDLYFVSSTKNAWFRITHFMESDSDFQMTVDNMKTILSLGNDITAESVDGSLTRKRFKSGSARIDSGVLGVSEAPNLRLPNMDAFKEIPKLFRKAAVFNSMVDDSTRMSSFKITSDSALYILESKKAICGLIYKGEEEILEGNFTHTYEAVNEIANNSGSYHLVRDQLYLNVDLTEDISITSCMKLSPSLATQEAKNLLTRFVVDDAYRSLQNIKLTVDMDKYMEVLSVLNKMDFSGSALIRIYDNNMSVVVIDNYRREYEHSIPCTCGSNISFTSFMISQAQLRILISSMLNPKKKDQYVIDMYLLPAYSKIIVTTSGAEEGFFPFVLLPMKVS